MYGRVEFPHLGDLEDRLYRHVAESPGVTAEQAAQALGAGAPEVGAAVEALRRLGLVSVRQDGGAGLVPHPVDFARIRVLNPLQSDLNRVQSLVDRLRGDLDRLDLHARRQQHDDSSVQVVPERDEVRRLIAGFAEQCREEALTSHPGGARDEALFEGMERTLRMLGRGVRMRTLYQHTARFSPATASYVHRMTELGARVRTLAGGFPRCIVFDQNIAILPLVDGAPGAAVVRDACVVAFLTESFERAWSMASEFPSDFHTSDRKTVTSEIQRTIASLLVQGESDKRISQVVGISLRNCQRHISAIMKNIGAHNRLHAGYLLGKHPFDGG
jgi:DNA-binding CsgD family transcriptional regulator